MFDFYVAILTGDGEIAYDGYARPFVAEHEWKDCGMPCVPMIFSTDNPPQFMSNTKKVAFPEYKGQDRTAIGVAFYDQPSGGEPQGGFRFGTSVTFVAGQTVSFSIGSLFLSRPISR